jgi:hypothetical protein
MNPGVAPTPVSGGTASTVQSIHRTSEFLVIMFLKKYTRDAPRDEPNVPEKPLNSLRVDPGALGCGVRRH